MNYPQGWPDAAQKGVTLIMNMSMSVKQPGLTRLGEMFMAALFHEKARGGSLD